MSKRMELTGQKRGQWTILEFSHMQKVPSGTSAAYWNCICDCGTNQKLSTSYLNSNKIGGCRECMHDRTPQRGMELTGQSFGNWKVKEFSHVYKSGSTSAYCWICECKCGRTKKTFTTSYLRSYSIGACRKCKADNMKVPCMGPYIIRIKTGAKARDLEFSIDRKYAQELYDKQNGICALSGISIHLAISTRSFMRGGSTASLDRIDSKIGYVPGNLQWVHKDINRMKCNIENDRFIELCNLISEYNK